MNADAFRQAVDRVREGTDLLALVGETVQLEAAGSVHKGRSPWNSDHTPSLVVWPHTQTWRDFSGGGSEGGDCFDWVKRRDGVDFGTALRTLAAKVGVALPGVGSAADEEVAAAAARRRVGTLLTEAAAYYHRALTPEMRQAAYREHYGFTDATIDELQLGWADGRLFEHLTSKVGASKEEALATGLFVQLSDGEVKDFFVNRLVFPYWSRGKVAYFIARITRSTPDLPWEKAKYKKLLTHSERHCYVSTTVANDTLYNEDSARGAAEVLITEGVTDCIAARQAGIACISPVTVRFRHQDYPKLLALTAKARRVVICNDTETSGAGEAGALETAKALHAAGRDVRLATIPLPEGQTKIDVNELVKTQGPEALREVVRQAKPLPEYLLGRIATGLKAADLNRELKPLLEMMAFASELEREEFYGLASERFELSRGLLQRLVKEQSQKEKSQEKAKEREQEKQRQQPTSNQAEPSHRGQVQEAGDHYYILREGLPLAVSTFRLEPRQRVRVESGEVLLADIACRNRRRIEGVSFPLEAFRSRKSFLRALDSADLQWFGSEENVQSVLALLTRGEVPSCQGTTTLGYYARKGASYWVSPSGTLTPLGIEKPADELRYVPSGASLDQRVTYAPIAEARERALAAAVLPRLLQLNRPEVILPILGWFFAAPLKPRLQKLLGQFPILMVWGTQGSGKSTLIMEVFWRLMGLTSTEPYSATETEFALLKVLSATNAVPVFIDEYKPFDMPKQRRNTLHRLMRRLFKGETEERGRADQTVATYRLDAPLCLAGETRPIEPALLERILTSNPSKDDLVNNPGFQSTFEAVRRLPLHELAPGLIRFLLARDTAVDLKSAQQLVDDEVEGREIPVRLRTNLLAMALGLLHFQAYAAQLGVALPAIDAGAAIQAICTDLLESDGTAVKTGLDLFLEELSVLAARGQILHGREYVYSNGRLALHFPSCHAAYAEHCRRIGFEGEVPDRKALRRQLDEATKRGSYVLEVDAVVTFNGTSDRRRAVLIDMATVKSSLAVDDFPLGQDSYGASNRWSSPGDPDGPVH